MARKLNKQTASSEAGNVAASAATKPKGRGKAATAAVPSNVTDETILAAVMEVGGYKTELETAQGKYRNALKKWEERGVSAADVVWILKTKRREVHELESEFRRRNRLMRLFEIPVGAQLGLFEDGESVGAKVDGDKIAKAAEQQKIVAGGEIAKAQAKGYDVGLRDYGPEFNPFGEGSPEALAWEAGRKEGLEQRRRAGADVTSDQPAAVPAK